MSNIKSLVYSMSLGAISVGLVIIAVGTISLRGLDQRMYEHAVDFYDLDQRFNLLTSVGANMCLAGCFGVALAIGSVDGFKAAVGTAVIGFATAVVGLAIFPIHQPSGAVYFMLLRVIFGASLIFFLIASIRSIWSRSH